MSRQVFIIGSDHTFVRLFGADVLVQTLVELVEGPRGEVPGRRRGGRAPLADRLLPARPREPFAVLAYRELCVNIQI